jgi:16S rRNA (cytosine1402-N4)-methyltransferase
MKVLSQPLEMEEIFYHYPVMYREVLEFLNIRNSRIIVDCTIGTGSHSIKFFEVMDRDSFIIGIDKDRDSLRICEQRLRPFIDRVTLIKNDFANLDGILKEVGVERADVFFFDLGISTYQLKNPERGFSFLKSGPLDMRMDRESFVSAYDLLNNLNEAELARMFRRFGEERYAGRIAHSIVERRRRSPLSDTLQLTKIIIGSLPYNMRGRKIHPATKIFQALRIAVNRELESLEKGIRKAIYLLNKRGRIGVISFHSLEDRIVKHLFKDFSLQGVLRILTKKPLTPTGEEKEENISSRSAKLRVAEKIN